MIAAKRAANTPIAQNVWFPVDAKLICVAMSAADAIGKKYRKKLLEEQGFQP